MSVSILAPYSPAPPSRESNPFATCWTRPGALPWVEAGDDSAKAIVNRLERADWRGQIVGPHGAGKSTLLRALARQLTEQDRSVITIDATSARGWQTHLTSDKVLLMLEGFERLDRPERSRWLHKTREAGFGVLVTTHRPLRTWAERLAVVATLRPTVGQLETLFERLTCDGTTAVTLADAHASFTRRRGNLRDVWFDLYDLHEQRTRQHRTTHAETS